MRWLKIAYTAILWLLLFWLLIEEFYVYAAVIALLMLYLWVEPKERGTPEMPVATVSPDDEPERKDLKSCPPDGYVLLKRLSHGQKMKRRKLSSKMVMKAQKGKKDVETEIDAFNEASELYDYATCIVDHNLTDHLNRKLDFKNPADVALLKGPIGEEISQYMDDLNNFEADEEVGNSQTPSETSS